MRTKFSSINLFCELAKVLNSGYYKWSKRADKSDKGYDGYLKIRYILGVFFA